MKMCNRWTEAKEQKRLQRICPIDLLSNEWRDFFIPSSCHATDC